MIISSVKQCMTGGKMSDPRDPRSGPGSSRGPGGPTPPLYVDSQGGLHRSQRKAWEANAQIEEMLGRRPCQGMLDYPDTPMGPPGPTDPRR